MPPEPSVKRAIVFVDGQNLFYAAKQAFGYNHPNDVALILSQDQDLTEAAEEVRLIASEQSRWIKVASAFPFSPTSTNRRGINKTDWIKIERQLYDACFDPQDYRPKGNL